MSWKSFIQFSITLLLGFSIGFAFSHSGPRHGPPDFDGPRERGRHFLDRFAEQLKLSDEQISKAKEIFKTQRQEMDQLRDETFPKFEEIKENTRTQIRALLNEAQAKEFDELHQELESRRKKMFPRRHHRRGPPGHRRGARIGGKKRGGGPGHRRDDWEHKQQGHIEPGQEGHPPPPPPPARGEIPIF